MWFVPRGGASTTAQQRRAPSLLLTTALLLCAIAIGVSPADASTITGASLATCEPSPCLQALGVETVELENVSNDDGTFSARAYAVERPQRLTGSAPAMLVFYGSGECGLSPSSRFPQLTAANRFVVVYMAVPCGRDNNWDKRNVDSATTTVPDDEPYVQAVVNDITRCPGQCVDPRRVYAGGMSSGGNMVADIMCDPQSSSLFRGFMIDSSSLQLFNGAPHCPSANRSFFVMLALSNYGIDASLYYDTDINPHLDVPSFAQWAGSRLGCGGESPTAGALGSPVASTLTYTYTGPCAYASAGSPAVVSLGVGNGAHGWGCQDSDLRAPPFLCPTMPTPPGLSPSGQPMTNGLYVEEQFWNFVAQGESSSESAPPPTDTIPPVETMSSPVNGSTVSGTVPIDVQATDNVAVAGVRLELDGARLGAASAGGGGTYSLPWNTTTTTNGSHLVRAIATDAAGNLTVSSALVTVENTPSSGEQPSGGPPGGGGTPGGGGSAGAGGPPSAGNTLSGIAPIGTPTSARPPAWIALGDDYSAGTGAPPYLAGTDASADGCRRSAATYTSIAARRLGVASSAVSVHACSGANVAGFFSPDGRNREPSQLSWVNPNTEMVALTVGWNDASMSTAIARCGRSPKRCRTSWSREFEASLASLGSSSSNAFSLRHLFKSIASTAPRATVVALGYPRLFGTHGPFSCRVDSGRLRFTRATMSFLNQQVGRLDHTIQAAAAAAHVTYISGSYGAFAGHELCTRRSYLNAAFNPNRLGQKALAALLLRTLQ